MARSNREAGRRSILRTADACYEKLWYHFRVPLESACTTVLKRRFPRLSLSVVTGSESPDSRWLPSVDANLSDAEPGIRSWLTYAGLLTRRIQQTCEDSFRLELLRFERDLLSAADTRLLGGSHQGMVRDIRLCCSGQPRVFARTVIPESTLREHPWLSRLGHTPLGETLKSRADARRSLFEFTSLEAGDNLFDTAVDGTGLEPAMLWARRSQFFLGAHALLVYEIFLPGVAECGSH